MSREKIAVAGSALPLACHGHGGRLVLLGHRLPSRLEKRNQTMVTVFPARVAPIAVLAMFVTVGVSAGEEEAVTLVRVTAKCPKAAYAYGEIIGLYVTFENMSEQELKLPLSDNMTVSDHSCLGLAKGKAGDHVPLGGRAFLSAGALVLAARESITILYDGLYLAPGQHELSVRYGFEPEYAQVPAVDGLWRGRIESEPVSVVVGEVTTTPKEQAAIDKRMRELTERLAGASSATRMRFLNTLSRYLPLTREFLRPLLHDEDRQVRSNVLVRIGRLTHERSPEEVGLPDGSSMLPEIIELGKTETDYYVKIRIVQALGLAKGVEDPETREKAISLLETYLDDDVPSMRGFAANSFVHVDPQRAGIAIKKRVGGKPRQLHPAYLNLLTQVLVGATGEGDIVKALDILIEGKNRREERGDP
jgi:hypothetical protein